MSSAIGLIVIMLLCFLFFASYLLLNVYHRCHFMGNECNSSNYADCIIIGFKEILKRFSGCLFYGLCLEVNINFVALCISVKSSWCKRNFTRLVVC